MNMRHPLTRTVALAAGTLLTPGWPACGACAVPALHVGASDHHRSCI